MYAATLANVNLRLPKNHNGPKGRSVPPSGLLDKASEIYRLCDYLEENWSVLSEEERASYKAIAYRALEREPNLSERIRYWIQALSAPAEALLQYRFAAWMLMNLILDKAEEDNGEFKSKIASAINEFDPDEDDMLVTPDNAIERLRELSR